MHSPFVTFSHHAHSSMSPSMSFSLRNRSAFIAAVRLIRLGGGISTEWISTMKSLFSVKRLSASIISNGTRYLKVHFKVSILSELCWRTFVSAPPISLSTPLITLIIPPFLHNILGKLSSFTSPTSWITVFEIFMVMIFTFLYSCYILILETFGKVTLFVCNFAAKTFSNLVAGNLIPCIVFITFFIYKASVNQVIRWTFNIFDLKL